MKSIILLIVFICSAPCVFAQQSDFCEAVTAILHDAPNRFKNVRGKEEKADYNVITWQTGVLVPGTIGSRFVAAQGLFYEGAFFQALAPTQVGAYYEKVKNGLNACLSPLGYKMSFSENFSPGLSAYKKVIFMLEPKGDEAPNAKAPAHVTLEALYNRDIKKYTVVMYIFEN